MALRRRMAASAVVLATVLLMPAPVPGQREEPAVAERGSVKPVHFAPPKVRIGDGVNLDLSLVTATIDAVVNDPRSWNTDLDRFTVSISLREYVTVICGFPPGAKSSACASLGTKTAWISADAWTGVLPIHPGVTVQQQRTWFVNHELGHLLGLPHQECPRRGAPAPVMRANMTELAGCTLNIWPNP